MFRVGERSLGITEAYSRRRGQWGTARMMLHDAILIGSRCIISTLASTRGPALGLKPPTVHPSTPIKKDCRL